MWLGNLFIGKGTLSASFLSRDSVPKILSQPKMAALIEYSICIPQRKPKKAIEFLACPKWRPRPINGSGHFWELSDVTTRHLARLWNFGTLRPKINPCPIDQPHPCHALPHSCRNTRKQSNVLNVPNGGPAPWTDMDTSGSVVTSLSVTWQGYGILGHSVPKLTLALLISLIHATHFHTHAETQKRNRMSWMSRTVASPHVRIWTLPGALWRH